MLRKKLKLISLALILLTTGSCTRYIYVDPVAIGVPARPQLERITDEEFSKLQAAYPDIVSKLAANDAILKAHIKRLEAIIRSTQK